MTQGKNTIAEFSTVLNVRSRDHHRKFRLSLQISSYDFEINSHRPGPKNLPKNNGVNSVKSVKKHFYTVNATLNKGGKMELLQKLTPFQPLQGTGNRVFGVLLKVFCIEVKSVS